MSWRTLIPTVALAITAACVHAAAARAIEFRSTNQMPDMVNQNAEKVAISNIGNAALNISYLEGEWKSVQIPSGQYITIPSESTGLSISFNDGVETKSLVLNRGSTYALYWNSGLNRWAIAPYDEVARRPSGLRSR
jgi:hypothetical protein